MVLRHLLAGASALAFAATAAAAQDNTVSINSTSSASPNNNQFACFQVAGSTGNDCTIIQNGTVNTAVGVQNGNSNVSYIEQRGANGAAVTANYAWHTQVGNSNNASTTQRTSNNSSTTYQNSAGFVAAGQAGNSATVIQQTGVGNSSSVEQAGRNQTASVTQSGTGNRSDLAQGDRVDVNGTRNAAFLGGANNTATVNQQGANQSSLIRQLSSNVLVSGNTATAVLVNNAANFTTPGQAGNTSSITQTSLNNTATVGLANGDAIGAQGGAAFNSGTISQTVGSNNDAQIAIGNPVNAALASQNSAATITQDSATGRNLAQVIITGGISGNDPGTTPNTGADTNGRSGGNTANVRQTGGTGYSTAVVTVGKLRNFQGLGNAVTVTQTASGNYNGTASPAQGTAATADRIAVNEPSFAEAANASGQTAVVYAQGRFGTVGITQNDDANSGVVYRDANNAATGVARARVNVFQAGEVNTVTTSQTGDNFADITQGRLGTNNQPTDRRNTLALTQTDAGDGPGVVTNGAPVTTLDEFGNPTTVTPTSTTAPRQYNQFVASQYGIGNAVQATQNARDAFMNVFQGTDATGNAAAAVGSAQATGLTADLQQGTGVTANSVGLASGNPGLPGTYTPPLQAGFAANGSGLNAGANSVGATLNFRQGGTNNAAQSYQDSSNSVINITQLGSSPFNGLSFVDQGEQASNYVGVLQQGTNNRATAIQNSTVGRSVGATGTATAASPASGNSAADNVAATGNPNAPADDFYFAGGGRSSQILILQGGTGNKARAEQSGLGQNARIEQSGTNNEAAILQGLNATNATAIIRQAGSGNKYFANQTVAGQYVAVDQYGTNNSSNQVIFRGPADGNSGFTAPANFPGF